MEVIAKDANGKVPMRPDGQQVSAWDFDFSVASSAPDAWGMQNNDPTRSFLCALAPTAPTATYTAHYPGRQLKPSQIIPGVVLQQSIEIAMEGVPAAPPPGAAVPPGASVPPGPSVPSGTSVPPGTYISSPSTPSGAMPPDASMQQPPMSDPSMSQVLPSPGAQPPPAPGYVGAGPGSVGSPAALQTAHNGKEFLRKIGLHAQQKAREVAAHTVDYTANATNEVVDTTLEAGSQVVSSNVQSMAGGVGQAGRSLFVGNEGTHDPRNLATALANGRAVLRGLRFQEHTATLDPSTGPVLSQLAQAMQATPGQYLIEGHVDKSEGDQAQALSEQRATAVKAALVSAGISPTQLAAVGYGSTRQLGGSGSSARIEIARTQ